ncbi:hypothetical protein C206_02809 [Pseudomonas putida TRO1]|uniref:Uncharacterized protein n=2 Tax=Pseudomonas putida TaxID=303 RepID=A0A1L7NPK2_PSEPU|nr:MULTISPECIES: hypothetical protein [Pseudomonas]HCF2575713.1 hypothetical protein [Pseudomonas aeruginosa]ELS0926363.1 hypothetical protein [Pseudomonas putida]ENY79242.1 hypothetical protein C206_02809 [Pseudomonas putida TRO1]MBA1318806.1 hypothetical protein [Pseudomonas monteilii]UWH25834.1 hypothetical protein KW568_30245 [Pseudomonas sp. HD6515]
MSNNEVKANQSSLDLYAVTLNWGMAEEGTYSDNVFATSQNEACLKIAEDMANQREYVDELETPKERQEWIVSRACDLVDCHFVEDSLAADLAALYGDVLFPDGVTRSIDLGALRALLVEHRHCLVPPAEVKEVEQLALHTVDSGYCRVYYKRQNGALCCFQLDTRNTFKLYHCSRDGEPEHEISHQNKAVFALPEDSGCSFVASFRAWWEQQSLQPTA